MRNIREMTLCCQNLLLCWNNQTNAHLQTNQIIIIMKKLLCFFVFGFYTLQLFGQNIIEGQLISTNKNGKIKTLSKESDDKIGFTPIKKEIIVSEGLFKVEIEGLPEVPRLVKIFGIDGFQVVSKDFYIDKDIKQIVLVETNPEKDLEVYVSPLNKNQIDFLERKCFFKENEKGWMEWENYLNEKIAKGEKIDRVVVDSLRNILIRNDAKRTKDYIKQNTNSYIALWDLYRSNYSISTFDSLYNNFNQTLKDSDLGKLYKVNREKLIFRQNKDFFKYGELQFKDKNLKNETFNTNSLTEGKYYLIDFWFSYCAPCIAEIPKYKELYSAYKDKGFEIISISSDRTKDINNWLNILETHKIPWKQFLDENGVETEKLEVYKFPTNFLIDSSGNVIQKDIPQYDLEKFLKENL